MSFHPAAVVVSLLSGVVVALLVNRHVKRTGALQRFRRALACTPGAPWRGAARAPLVARSAPAGRDRWARAAAVGHLVLLGGGAGLLSVAPAFQGPYALSQALLLLFVLYPLALLDLLTLAVEAQLVLAGLALRLAAVALAAREALVETLAGMVGGAGLLYLIGFAYETLRRRRGLGEGDAAVLGLVGAFVGWQGVLPTVLGATALGLLAGFPALLLLRKPLGTPLPFVPFLCAAGLLVFIAQAHGWLRWAMPF